MMRGYQASFSVWSSFTSSLLKSPFVPFCVTLTSKATGISPSTIVISETGLDGLNLSLYSIIPSSILSSTSSACLTDSNSVSLSV